MDLLTSQIAEKEAEAQNLQAELQRHRSQEEACSTTAAEANSKLQVTASIINIVDSGHLMFT